MAGSTIIGAGGFALESYDYVWTGISEVNTDGSDISILRNVPAIAFGVIGNFGVSGAVQLMGSFDGTNYFQMKDALGAAVSLTANGMVAINNPPLFIHPRVTAGTGVLVNAYIHGTVLD